MLRLTANQPLHGIRFSSISSLALRPPNLLTYSEGAIKLATQEFIASKAHIATYIETPPPPSSITLPSHDLDMAYYAQTTTITEDSHAPRSRRLRLDSHQGSQQGLSSRVGDARYTDCPKELCVYIRVPDLRATRTVPTVPLSCSDSSAAH